MVREIDYPRVLILGQNFDSVTGGGITLGNFFYGWPIERLAVASFSSCDMDPAPCGRQYLLGQAERRWIRPFRFAELLGDPPDEPQGSTAGRPPQRSLLSTNSGGRHVRLRPAARSIFRAMVRSLGSDEFFRPLSVSEQFLSWSTSFQPDVVYTFLGNLSMIRLTLELAHTLRSPIAVHMMDDWPAVIYGRGLLGRRLRTRTDHELRTILDLAAARLAISEAMATEYAERYGHDWSAFHNPVDLQRWSEARRTSWYLQSEYRIVYSGRVGPGTESSLLDVSQAVAVLRRQGRRIRFDIWSPYFDHTDDSRFARFEGVSTHGAVTDSDMPATLARADTLVLPFDFHGRPATLFRLSFPTKAPGYMASGTPVLVYAPPTHAVALDAVSRGWGHVVSKPGVPSLVEAIVSLMDDEALRRTLGNCALKEVGERYDADTVRARFALTLSSAAAKAPPNLQRG
ncbi:MAG: glycosyltransferase family 4 protein [Armatimonadetes bacterium]|nr:glycosyltransferase family 4 protein [Armatimonadota bacterium]